MTSKRESTPERRAVCPHCGKAVPVTGRGTFKLHSRQDPNVSVWRERKAKCPSSAAPVPDGAVAAYLRSLARAARENAVRHAEFARRRREEAEKLLREAAEFDARVADDEACAVTYDAAVVAEGSR